MVLMQGGIQESNIFTHLPRFDEIAYDGYLEGKVRKYRAIREELVCHVLVLNVIRKDEDIIWGAFEDLIKRSVNDAAVAVSGVYVFDVLTKDIHKEVNTYKHAEITELLSRRGVSRLYLHQARCYENVREGHNTVVLTPTASGKTLCYNLPVFQSIRQR